MSVNINDIITAINSDYLKISNLEALNTLQLESLKNRVLDTIEKVKLITLPIETLNKLNIISFTLNGYIKTLNGIKFSSSGYKNAFEYTPVLNSKKHYSNDTNLITQLSSVNLGKVLGVNKIKQGLIDDVFGYDGKSTLSLSKNTKVPQDRYLHKIKIKDKYSTSFEFRLNRFPVDLVELKQLEKQERDNEKLKKDFDIMLPFLKDKFNDNVKLLIVGRFLVTNFNDELKSFILY